MNKVISIIAAASDFYLIKEAVDLIERSVKQRLEKNTKCRNLFGDVGSYLKIHQMELQYLHSYFLSLEIEDISTTTTITTTTTKDPLTIIADNPLLYQPPKVYCLCDFTSMLFGDDWHNTAQLLRIKFMNMSPPMS